MKRFTLRIRVEDLLVLPLNTLTWAFVFHLGNTLWLHAAPVPTWLVLLVAILLRRPFEAELTRL
jgi:hypothetical protein